MPEAEPETVSHLAEVLSEVGATVAVAESLTGGSLSATLAVGHASSRWYRGAIVSYSSEVKRRLLGVPDGPVVSEQASVAMSRSVCTLLGADVALAVTGVGGPDPQDDQPPGTVWMALYDRRRNQHETRLEHFSGSPSDIVEQTCECSVRWLLEHCQGGTE